MNLKKLQVVTCTGFPMMLSLLPPDSRVPLKRLAFDRDLLSRNEFTVIGRVCSEVTHLTKVTPESSCDLDEEGFQGAFDQRDRHFSENVCHFLEHAENMTQIQSFQGRLTFCCVNNFFSIRGSNITALKLTTEITDLGDILTLRRFVPKLEILEGNFSVRPDNHFNAMSSRYQEHILRHRMYNPKFDPGYLGTGSSFSEEINTILRSTPMVNLKTVDIEGKLTMTALQLFVGGVEFLEDLHVTNSPVNTDTKAWSDEWLEALVHVNKMTSIKNITLRMVKDQVVESGSFSDRGLIKFLDHCLDHCQKITRLVGEFTKIPDKSLRDKTEVYARKGLRRLKIRNAVPYRKFENIYDAERYYGMNEGYQLFLQAQIAQQQQQQQQFIGQMEGMNLHPGPLPAAVQQQAPLLNPAEANGGGAAAFAMPPFHINQQAGEIPGVVMEPPPQPQEDEEGGAQHKNVPHKVNGRFKGYVFKPLGDSRNDEDSDG